MGRPTKESQFDLIHFQEELDKLNLKVDSLLNNFAMLRTRVNGNLADQLAEIKQHVAQLENFLRQKSS